ncbi:MAG: hypothetical protein VW299_05950 [Alphaproteobacteria bacterium]
MKKIIRRRWRQGDTRYELAVEGSEVTIDTYPANLKKMQNRFSRVGYHSTGCSRRFNKPEEAEKFAKELNPKEFKTLEGLGFEDFTELISD